MTYMYLNGKAIEKNTKAQLLTHIKRQDKRIEAKQTRIMRQHDIIKRNKDRHLRQMNFYVNKLHTLQQRFWKMFDKVYGSN